MSVTSEVVLLYVVRSLDTLLRAPTLGSFLRVTDAKAPGRAVMMPLLGRYSVFTKRLVGDMPIWTATATWRRKDAGFHGSESGIVGGQGGLNLMNLIGRFQGFE